MRTLRHYSKSLDSSRASSGFTIVELLIVVVVIAILAAITIVAFNGVTNKAKDSARVSELAQWKKKSEVQKIQNNIECPENYAFVYGNSALGTSDFCVMKYEAKSVGGVATSQASGTPWVSISQANAITASVATGGHLLTEAEWMTIAADALSVKYNWSSGVVGQGYIYSGHNDNSPSSALAASTDDDGYSGTGNSTATGNNQRRTLYLTSGDTIWDMSGNVHEWTAPAQAMSQVGVSGDAAFNWRAWSLGSLNLGNLPVASRPGTLNAYVNPITGASLSGIASWDSTKGVGGQVYANYADTATRAFRRGGDWTYGTNAGMLTLVLSAAQTDSSANIGFRVAR